MKLKLALSAAVLSVASIFGSTAPALAEAKVVKQVAPEYPRGAERRELEGSVSMSFDVNDAGKVENIAVTDASMPGVFDKAAMKALEKWKFESGSPDTGINVTINFQL